jgi:hypothetical protein
MANLSAHRDFGAEPAEVLDYQKRPRSDENEIRPIVGEEIVGGREYQQKIEMQTSET